MYSKDTFATLEIINSYSYNIFELLKQICMKYLQSCWYTPKTAPYLVNG